MRLLDRWHWAIRWWIAPGAAVLALGVATAVARADETVAGDQYRLTAREATLDIDGRQAHAVGDAVLTYDGIELHADVIDVDVAAQSAIAHGHVRVSQQGNVLSANTITYNLRDGTGLLTDASGHLQTLYFSARSLQVTPLQLVLTAGSFTTCEETPPHYRITAQQIIVRPRQSAVARKAALWFGRHRLLSLPRWRHSLAPDVVTTPWVPFGGYSHADGAFGGLQYLALATPTTTATLEARYTTSRSIRASAVFHRRRGWGDLDASVSRRDDPTRLDFGLFAPRHPDTTVTVDRLPEVAVRIPVAAARWAQVELNVGAGHYREAPAGAGASRGLVDLRVTGQPLAVARNLDLRPVAGVRGLRYDNDQSRSAVAYGAYLESRPSPRLAAGIGYLRREAYGAGPFAFDTLDSTREVDLGVAARVGTGWRIEALLRRDFQTNTFPALDVAVTRVAHCLEYGLTWRQVTHEFGIRFGLAQTGTLSAPRLFDDRPMGG